MADNTVTLTIDGQEVTVPKGTTLLEAAKQAGKDVPHYCYHPGMSSPAPSTSTRQSRHCAGEDIPGW